MHSSILRRIWLNFMAQYLFFSALIQFSHFFLRIFNFFGVVVAGGTWVVKMRIWCIKIGIVLVLHATYAVTRDVSFIRFHQKDRLIQSPLTLRKGIRRTYSNPDPYWSPFSRILRHVRGCKNLFYPLFSRVHFNRTITLHLCGNSAPEKSLSDCKCNCSLQSWTSTN
jgi:hypothetical protein